MGEDGISQVDSAAGQFLAPLPNPQVQDRRRLLRHPTNRFGFTMSGISGQTAVVEACTNLAAPVWVPLSRTPSPAVRRILAIPSGRITPAVTTGCGCNRFLIESQPVAAHPAGPSQ